MYNNRKLGENNKLPVYVKGSDQESGLKKIALYTNSNLTKEKKKLEIKTYENSNLFEYSIGNTKRTGDMYYTEVEDNVGNKRICKANFKVDTTPPSCKKTGIESGEKKNKVSNRQWYLTDVTTYGYFTAEKQISAVLNRTSKYAQTSTIYQKDRAGNSKKCPSTPVQIDKTPPTLSAEALNKSSNFSANGCGSSSTCRLAYGKVDSLYRRVNLTANNNTGARKHSPPADWGAKAKYERGGRNCAWGDGIDYKWSGSEVCSSPGTGRVKRCYKVKDADGNESERVCTCQKENGKVTLDAPSSCF